MPSTSPSLAANERLDPRPPQGPPARPVRARAFFPAFALALLMLAPTLLYPVGRDTANFLYCARVMTRGGVLYRDAWELKPPGIFLAYSALTRTCAGAALVPYTHLVDIALCGLVGVLLVQLANAYGTPAAGWAAAAWYYSFYFEGGFGNFGETEGWANPAVLAATLCCMLAAARRERSDRELCLAGLFAAIAFLIKFTTLAPLVPFFALALWRRRSLRAIALCAGSFTIPVVCAVFWLKAIGGWSAYLDIDHNFIVPYIAYSRRPTIPHLKDLLDFVAIYAQLLWLPAIFALVATRSRNWPAQWKLPTFAALAMCVAAIWIQQKFILYYWQALLPLIALLAALGSLELMRLARVPVRRQATFALLIALGWHACRNLPEYHLAARYAMGRLSGSAWWAHFALPDEGDPIGKAYAAAKFVKTHTEPDDPVLQYGFESMIYILSDRYAPTRFFFDPPVVSAYAPDAWRAEFIGDLQRNPPKVILLRHGDKSDWIGGPTGDSCALFRGSPPLEKFLEAKYHLDHDDGGFAYFLRNDSIAMHLKPSQIQTRNLSQ